MAEPPEKEVDGYQRKKGPLLERIEDPDRQIQQLKVLRKRTPHRIPIEEPPESDRSSRPLTDR
jgi:hypothetical protein